MIYVANMRDTVVKVGRVTLNDFDAVKGTPPRNFPQTNQKVTVTHLAITRKTFRNDVVQHIHLPRYSQLTTSVHLRF